MAVQVNDTVSFTYETLDGEVKHVDRLHVDRVFTSSEGNRIVQGWLDPDNIVARAYREANMTEVEQVVE